MEEAQCFELPQPEGAVASRMLPIIEEEDTGLASPSDPLQEHVEEEEACLSDAQLNQCESSVGMEIAERILQLNSQINALSESNRNLEVEIQSSR